MLKGGTISELENHRASGRNRNLRHPLRKRILIKFRQTECLGAFLFENVLSYRAGETVCSLALVCAAAVESVTLPKLTGLGPVLPGIAYKTGTAEAAFDFRGEAAGVDAPVGQSPELPPPCNLSLHRLISLHRDDGLVGVLHEILRQLTVVFARLFADGVKRVFLLEQQVPGIGDVFEDGPNRAVGKMHPLHGLDAHLLQLFFRCLSGEALQEIVVDEPDDFGFLWLDDQMVAFPTVAVNQEPSVGDALLKALPGAPFDVL